MTNAIRYNAAEVVRGLRRRLRETGPGKVTQAPILVGVAAVVLLVAAPTEGQVPNQEETGRPTESVLPAATTQTATEQVAGGASAAGSETECSSEPESPEGARWTGECQDGAKHGAGFVLLADGAVWEGEFNDGLAQGPWSLTEADGLVLRGAYVDGKREGRWVSERGADTGGGIYVGGERFGHWKILVTANDDASVRGVTEGTFLDGERHGVFTTRFESGTVHRGEYVHGTRHGEWSHEYSSGARDAGSYKQGERDGYWTMRSARGAVSEGVLSAGVKHGRWTERTEGGEEHLGEYSEGKRQGEWIERDAEGWTRTYTYAQGEIEGRYSSRNPSGAVVSEGTYGPGRSKTGFWKELLHGRGGGTAQGVYADGERHGKWVFEWSDGRRDEGPYSNGVRNGLWVTSQDGQNAQQAMFVDGESQGWKRTGRWREQQDDGTWSSGTYVDGKKTGEWHERDHASRARVTLLRGRSYVYAEGSYTDGKRDGRWVYSSIVYDGLVKDLEMYYLDGELHGPRTTIGRKPKVVDYYVLGERVERREWKNWQRANRRP